MSGMIAILVASGLCDVVWRLNRSFGVVSCPAMLASVVSVLVECARALFDLVERESEHGPPEQAVP